MNRHKQHGFTLLEMMLTITVAAVIMGLAIPNMSQFMRNNRVTAASNDLLAATYKAKTESIKNRSWTVLCAASAPKAAVPACNGTFSQGWIVFVDTNNNGKIDGAETVSLRHDALDNSLSAKAVPAGNGKYISYAPSGFSVATPALGTQMTSVIVCNSTDGNKQIYGTDNSTARSIDIQLIGSASVNRSVTSISAKGGC
jgi:type IV fimbrial biogenesis protein FimT